MEEKIKSFKDASSKLENSFNQLAEVKKPFNL
jgi:hypothetical protein